MRIASRAEESPSDSALPLRRILLVDDDPFVLRSYTRALKRAGYDTLLATDGEAALEILGTGSPHAIVSDIGMPRMDGLALLKALRDRDAQIPVLLVTGAPELKTAVQAIDYGAVKYLSKPVTGDALCEAVRLALAPENDRRSGSAAARELEAGLDAAIHSICMAYQPIVAWRQRRLQGYEALLRCEHGSLATPGEIVAAAEKLGRIDELGRAVRARVASAVLELPEGPSVFVNLHPRELEDEELHDPRSPLSTVARRVVLEITERTSLESVGAPRERVESLRKLGFRIALDDLGAGYSGLSALLLLEPDLVKIDKSIVRDVENRPNNQSVIRSILALSREMGARAVTEGVETPAERDALVELGCDLFQGYLFGRPQRGFTSPRW